MNIRDAILKAADHIKRHPKEFNFNSCDVPGAKHCGTPWCAVGWIACFSGIRKFRDALVTLVGHDKFGAGTEFYDRLDEIEDGWRYSHKRCALALRLYADKYHPAAYVRDEAAAADFLTALNKLIRDGANHPASRAQV